MMRINNKIGVMDYLHAAFLRILDESFLEFIFINTALVVMTILIKAIIYRSEIQSDDIIVKSQGKFNIYFISIELGLMGLVGVYTAMQLHLCTSVVGGKFLMIVIIMMFSSVALAVYSKKTLGSMISVNALIFVYIPNSLGLASVVIALVSLFGTRQS